MTSKEALKKINQYWADMNVLGKSDIVLSNEDWDEVYKDLDRLEKLEEVVDILNKYPKMINESVRFDSAYGVQMMLGVSKEQAEEMKKGYRLIKEVL